MIGGAEDMTYGAPEHAHTDRRAHERRNHCCTSASTYAERQRDMQNEPQLTPLQKLTPWQRPRAAAVMSAPASGVDHRPERHQLQRMRRPTLLELRIVCAATRHG